MNITPEWVSAGCAVVAVVVSIIALRSSASASSQNSKLNSQVNSLTSQVSMLTSEINRVSSSTKDSDIKQVNKSGSGNRFIGGSYNERG